MKTFFHELKRRRVYRVALAYVIAGSAAVQLIGTVLPMFHAPDWAQQLFVLVVALGFPVALVFGWVFEIRHGGLQKTVVAAASGEANNRRLLVLALTGCVVAAIALVIYWEWHPWRRMAGSPGTSRLLSPASDATPSIPNKSIAVLPFDNLGDAKDDAQFAEGVHDEILTDLAKVADLRVISRTSVMQYRSGAERNLREIAKALGVAHVVEGTVQRTGNRVRVSAQLIDARTDMHLWADRYDRDLSDVFALESELAEIIVSQLATKLSPQEKAAIEEQPTADLAAYELYSRANTLIATIVFNTRSKDNLFEAARLLDNAVALDPSFLLAYCQLARTHDLIYLLALDHTPARLALANAAVEATLHLRPNAGEARLALAHYLYCGFLDYDRAREELLMAGGVLPNEPLVFELMGYIDRRQGRWEESIRALQRALVLDPRNAFLFQQIALTYSKLRQYAQMAEALDHALLLVPMDVGTRIQRAFVELDWHGNLSPLQEIIPRILAEDPSAAGELAQVWFILACYERDATEISRAVAAMPANGCREEGVAFPHAWCEGLAARTRGDIAGARAAFTTARAEQEKIVREQPDYGEAICALGMIDAGLGRKKEAIEEGRRAIELLPLSKDSINGALLIQYLAIIYAWTGEKDSALEQLALAVRIPSDLSYAQLRLHPFWDALRGDPRFEQIVASLAPSDEMSKHDR